MLFKVRHYSTISQTDSIRTNPLISNANLMFPPNSVWCLVCLMSGRKWLCSTHCYTMYSQMSFSNHKFHYWIQLLYMLKNKRTTVCYTSLLFSYFTKEEMRHEILSQTSIIKLLRQSEIAVTHSLFSCKNAYWFSREKLTFKTIFTLSSMLQ